MDRLSGRSSLLRDLSSAKNNVPLMAPGITKQQQPPQQKSHPIPMAPHVPVFDDRRLAQGTTMSHQQPPHQLPHNYGTPIAAPANRPAVLLSDPVPRTNNFMRPSSTGQQPAFPFGFREQTDNPAIQPLMGGADVTEHCRVRGSANGHRYQGIGRSVYLARSLRASCMEGEDPFSASIPVPNDMVKAAAAVEVAGLPSDVDATCLRHYLEIATDFTAAVVSILFRSGRHSAVVHFSQNIDLKKVKDFCATVPLYDDHQFIEIDEVAEASAIQICGLEKPCTERYAKIIVEHYILKHSIPTAISKVVMADDIAVISLTSSKGCRLLVKNMRRSPEHYRSVVPFYRNLGITAESDMIYCTSYQSTSTGATTVGRRQQTLFVGGFTKVLDSEKHVRSFFSNSRGGGEECIEEFLIDDKMVVLRYANNSVADRVIDKIARRDLKFENDSLWIAVGWHRQHALCDGRVFILRNLPAEISRVTLLYFLWAKACSRVLSVCFSLQKNMALVEFEQGVNFESLYSAIAGGEFFQATSNLDDSSGTARPFELLQIPLVTCLQFSGVPENVSEQFVRLFVNDLCKCHAQVEARMESGACALRLASQKEASDVSIADIQLKGYVLRVTPYHTMTGLTTEDEMSIAWLLPAPLALDFVKGPVLAHIVSSPAVRRALEEKLGSAHARLVEPSDNATAVNGRLSQAKASVGGWSVKCQVANVTAASAKSFAILRGQWRASLMRVIEAFCADFTSESIEVDVRIWPRVHQFITTSTSRIGDFEAISLSSEEDTDDGVHRVVVVGRREAVHAAVEQAVRQATESGIGTGSNDSAKQSDSDASSGKCGGATATEGCLSFDVLRRERIYLQYRQVGTRLKTDVNASVVVTLQPGGRISISGPEDTLQPAAAYIRSMLDRLVHRQVPLPVAATQLMVQREGYQHMVASLKKARVSAFWESDGNVGIVMCAGSASDLEKAIGVVHAQLKTFDVKASDSERANAALSSPEFASSVDEIRHQWQKQAVVIQFSADRLSAAAALPHARAIFDLSQQWDFTIEQTRQVIHIDNILVYSLLRCHVRTLFGDKGVYISFEEKDEGGSGDVVVSAPAALGSAICGEVQSVLSRVSRNWLLVSDEARINWLTSPAGHNFLIALSRQGLTLARCFKTERLATCLRTDGRRLVIVHGCALLQNGQCLMIGSNSKFELTASLTGQQLLNIDGQAVQNYILKNNKKANQQDGDCFITIAGKRPYKGIIHVVCPSYQPDTLAVSDDPLIFALLKGLQAVSNKKYSSIVLPSIGSDGFGYPSDIGAELLVKALNMHFDQTPDSSIRDVIVADMNKSAVNFVYAATEKFTTQAPTKDKLGPESNSIVTAHGLAVDVVRGNIEQQKVDAVVNCLLSNGDLNHSGSVSSRLSRAAGAELQQAFRRLAPGSQLDRGRVVPTKGYGLPCQYVINVCCGNRFESVDPKVLSGYIGSCLSQADELGAKTLAVPLLGVDTLNISSTAIAQAIFLALSMYKVQHLKAVYCVANDDVSLEVFRAQRHEVLGSAKAIEVDDPVVTPSLCVEVLALSGNDVEDAIARVSAKLCEQEKASNSDSRKL